MDIYTAAELAYKNGYRKGVQDTMTNEMPRYVAYITHDVAHIRHDGYIDLDAKTCVEALSECEDHYNEFMESVVVMESHKSDPTLFTPTLITRDGATWRICRKRATIKRYGDGSFNVIACELEEQ